MNKNLNLVEILKNCPKWTKLYSTVLGDVYLNKVNGTTNYPISVTSVDSTNRHSFTSDGRLWANYKGECVLFPSKDQRDWSKFKTKLQQKFDPKTLQPFDKVLVSDNGIDWHCELYSNYDGLNEVYKYKCVGQSYKYCIPYNDDTKRLLGTTENPPEFYRYWEF